MPSFGLAKSSVIIIVFSAMALESINLLGILADKIEEIDPEETPWVKSYLT